MSPVIQTYTGRAFPISDPKASDVCIADIAAALSKQCRFTGHTKRFYSVAEHCVNVSLVVPKNMALAGLLHDASEAYVTDISSPLKSLLPEYKAIEKRVQQAIFDCYGLEFPYQQEVKDADEACLIAERNELLGPCPFEWQVKAEPATIFVVGLPPSDAERLFLNRFAELS